MSRIDAYTDLIEGASVKYNVNPTLIRAVMGQESGGNPGAVSNKGAQGLMQLMPGTARRMGVSDITDPAQNIDGGTRYLRLLLDRFKGNVPLALAGYNAGEGAVDKYQGIPPYAETRTYVQRIMGNFGRMAGRALQSVIPPAQAETDRGITWDTPRAAAAAERGIQWDTDRPELLPAPAPAKPVFDLSPRIDWDTPGGGAQRPADTGEQGITWDTAESPGTLAKIGQTLALLPQSAQASAGGAMQATGAALKDYGQAAQQDTWAQR